MKNKNIILSDNRKLIDLLHIETHEEFHDYLLCETISRYAAHRSISGQKLGRVLALCANYREASALKKYTFDKIILTGITTPDQKLIDEINRDKRLHYEMENAECLSFESKSFDLVLCKEGLHHLARPALGFYEMLRISNDAVILIEPAHTILGSFFEKIGLSSVYEKNQNGNINLRDNYVFRWNLDWLEGLLNSYYINSGYSLNVVCGWMSSSLNANKIKAIRFFSAIAGWMAGFTPGSKGNYLSAMIIAGQDIPPDPQRMSKIPH